ncbi:unnamed protein product [Rotaria sp. Silwood1]|nr:unnamed protein product [Rotaria sp. Silwood1]CAF3450913.1 unnamed protein product [Rotaria sp. Silwood1]CAF3464045.1 unnamed protein product [Rotaria sp. Silwood1]CAF4652037.1 unnamed protein product [Rotaria sp. Silwood1]CAF4884805.1 unnamed protein product [Rotaria sp. Silwood1]
MLRNVNVDLYHLKKIHLNVEEAIVQGVDPIKSYYMQKLEEIHLFERPFLNVHCAYIKQLDKIMYHQLIAYSQEVIPLFDIAVNKLFFTIYEDDTLPHQIQVQSYNVDIFRNICCHDPEDIDKLVSLTGMVIRSL